MSCGFLPAVLYLHKQACLGLNGFFVHLFDPKVEISWGEQREKCLVDVVQVFNPNSLSLVSELVEFLH